MYFYNPLPESLVQYLPILAELLLGINGEFHVRSTPSPMMDNSETAIKKSSEEKTHPCIIIDVFLSHFEHTPRVKVSLIFFMDVRNVINISFMQC